MSQLENRKMTEIRLSASLHHKKTGASPKTSPVSNLDNTHNPKSIQNLDKKSQNQATFCGAATQKRVTSDTRSKTKKHINELSNR
jgi:hypothetical protein